MPKDWIDQYKQVTAGHTSEKLEEDFELFYRLSELNDRPVDTEKAWYALRQKIQVPEKKRILFSALRIAASIAVILSLALAIYQTDYFNNDQLVRLENSEDLHTFDLPDGSQVTLTGPGYIEYKAGDFAPRTVAFEGNAFFDINKGIAPFIVITPNAEITVIGTEFNLNTIDAFELSVVEGVVSLKTGLEERKLYKGEEATLNASGLIVQELKDPNKFSWKTGEFFFRDTRLKDAFPYLEKYYNRSFISDEALGNCKISADFKSKSLEEVTEVLSTILNAETVISATQVKFSGAGCN